jgi:RNA recognition motif-containing protein
MAKKLYVGNLSYQTTDDSLRAAFGEYGQIESVNVVTDRYTGRSRGFGFVEMSTDAEAQAAIGGLDGKMLDGREIKVAEAKPQADRGRRGADRGRSRW